MGVGVFVGSPGFGVFVGVFVGPEGLVGVGVGTGVEVEVAHLGQLFKLLQLVQRTLQSGPQESPQLGTQFPAQLPPDIRQEGLPKLQDPSLTVQLTCSTPEQFVLQQLLLFTQPDDVQTSHLLQSLRTPLYSSRHPVSPQAA